MLPAMDRVSRQDIVAAIAFALRRHIQGSRGRNWPKTFAADEVARKVAAEEVVKHLELSRVEFWRPPPAPWHKSPP